MVEHSIDQVDTMLAPSEYTAKRHRDAGLKPPIHVLPLFSAIEPRADATAPRPARPRFLFVGRLTASKGIVQLLQEFAALSAFDLHVIGDGELRGELQHEGGALRIVVATGLRAWIARGSRSEGARGFLAAVYTTASPQRLPGSRGVNPTRKGRSLRFSCVRS